MTEMVLEVLSNPELQLIALLCVASVAMVRIRRRRSDRRSASVPEDFFSGRLEQIQQNYHYRG